MNVSNIINSFTTWFCATSLIVQCLVLIVRLEEFSSKLPPPLCNHSHLSAIAHFFHLFSLFGYWWNKYCPYTLAVLQRTGWRFLIQNQLFCCSVKPVLSEWQMSTQQRCMHDCLTEIRRSQLR